MKKIGILTYHYPENKNFGAMLQAYSLRKIIDNLGYNCKIIDFNRTKFLSGINFKGKISLLIEARGYKNFYRKFYEKTQECITLNELKALNKELDIFIVGSDQVWRIWNEKEFLPEYFLNFVLDEKRKISYAASFGLENWDEEEEITKQVKKLLKKFDYISVREESGVDICKNTFGVDSVCVLDPTLILSKEYYQEIIEDYKGNFHLKKKYIAHMLLDDNDILKKYCEKIAGKLKCKINRIKGRKIKILNKELTIYNSVGQWLTYLKNSELVITDSFHCTVFAIIFHKKFVVIANPHRGNTRLENLLKIVGLEDRFFTDIKEVEKSGILEKEIDYEAVEKKLYVKRKYSIDFLKNALGDNQ